MVSHGLLNRISLRQAILPQSPRSPQRPDRISPWRAWCLCVSVGFHDENCCGPRGRPGYDLKRVSLSTPVGRVARPTRKRRRYPDRGSSDAGLPVNRDGSWIQGLLCLREDLPIPNFQPPTSPFHVAYATSNRDVAEATGTFSAAARWHVAAAASSESAKPPRRANTGFTRGPGDRGVGATARAHPVVRVERVAILPRQKPRPLEPPGSGVTTQGSR